MKIWEPKHPGTLWATPGLLQDSIKMVLFEQKKTKLWNKQHLVENNTEIMQHALKMQ